MVRRARPHGRSGSRVASDSSASAKKMDTYEDTLEEGGVDDCESLFQFQWLTDARHSHF